jgi:hypothetical protein
MRDAWIVAVCLASCGPNRHDGGTCDSDPSCNNVDAAPADSCPAVQFTAKPTTPTIELLIDQSLSMSSTFGATTRYKAVQDALVAPGTGVVTELEASAYFGATLFTSALTCPALQVVPRAINNSAAISAMIAANGPGLYTPTGDAITAVTADFAASPPPAGSPPFIVLATDGIPNTCQNPLDETNGSILAVAAAKAAFAAGIKLVVLSVGPDTSIPNLQAMANAGAGVQPGQPDAPYYQGDDPQTLADAFKQIIGGVLSCDLSLSGQIDPASAMDGTVTLDGVTLTYGTDWIIVNGTTIEILGAACMKLQTTPNSVVDATFPCTAVIL